MAYGKEVLFESADSFIYSGLTGEAKRSEQYGGRWYVNPFPNTKFSTFAYTQLYYRIIDKFREEIEERKKPQEVARSRSLYDETPERESKWEIGNLDFLSDTDNQITKLKAEGYTQEEIAEEVELSQGTVSKHLEGIKKTLKEKIREDKTWDKRNIYQSKHGHLAPGHDSPGEESRLETSRIYHFRNMRPKGKATNTDKYPAGSWFYLTYTKNKKYNPNPDKVDFVEQTYQEFYRQKLESLERKVSATREDLENMLKTPAEIQSGRQRIISTLHTIINEEEEEKSRVKIFD